MPACVDRLQHHQRHLGDRRAAGGRDLDRADALALGERRDQRVGALDLGLQLAALAAAARSRTPPPAAPSLASLAVPFQTGSVTIGLPSSNRRTVSKAWKPQFSSFWLSLARASIEVVLSTTVSSRRLPAPPLAEVRELALRGGDQAVAGGLGVAGLHAVDRRVAAQQQVAVGLA